ncbi:MAG: hypothetical protein CM15mP30_3990 [Pelagibacteraceae bacterium]|nr:MAG: hypothetical protein CM15mP30_3990 [Pelagibacteraceae bacterium]
MELSIIFFVIILIFFSPLILGLIFMGAQKKINLKHTNSSLNKPGFVGYCWTYFFFSFFVPIFRGEILIGVLHLIFSLVTFGLFQLVIPFLYNKQFTSRMLTSGWELSDTEENMQIARLKLGIGN